MSMEGIPTGISSAPAFIRRRISPNTGNVFADSFWVWKSFPKPWARFPSAVPDHSLRGPGIEERIPSCFPPGPDRSPKPPRTDRSERPGAAGWPARPARLDQDRSPRPGLPRTPRVRSLREAVGGPDSSRCGLYGTKSPPKPILRLDFDSIEPIPRPKSASANPIESESL